MKLAFLFRSPRLPKRRSRLSLAAALLMVVAMVGVFFSHPSVAHAGGCPSDAFVNQQTGYFLDVAGETPIHGAPVDQWYGGDGSSSEAWILHSVSGGPVAFLQDSGPYYIQNANGGKYLDVAGASTADGASVIQWYFNGNANQQWWIYQAGDGNEYIQNVNSGLFLDVATSDPGAAAIQDSYQNWLSQEWSIGC